ncbi:hypothetical protein ACIO3O_01790 [Streptomyces sp. NPDC087440]|uniref:hypothetical protein n=1 Tax=Streptomyces sp. NPDC087440 TaxID=3365790 RepID=UPI0038087411
MSVIEVVARVMVGTGHPVERLFCHPRLPLIAGLDSERPAVRVWSFEDGGLTEVGVVGGESAVYGDPSNWDRYDRIPGVAWHPRQPLLVVAGEDGAVQWTPGGVTALEGLGSAARVAFAPDGRSLWASPSSEGEGDTEEAWESSDVLDLVTGKVSRGPRWDTGVAEHPGGSLVATLASDQGATHVLFARTDPDPDATPAAAHSSVPASASALAPASALAMRVLRRALILDVDGYEAPVFSPDGRHFAIRGNAYANTLSVFAFPSLRRVLATQLGEPRPAHPHPPEWMDQLESWSHQNIAFGVRPGILWIGTPTGTLVELDIEAAHATEHAPLPHFPVTALATTATGQLALAHGEGGLALLSVADDFALPQPDTARKHCDTAQAAVAAYVAGTSEVPAAEGNLESHLDLTDGAREWGPSDLETVTAVSETDPSWLQIRAAMNTWQERDA